MIAKGEQRFGERVDNPFGEGEATYWFHLNCAALMRPEPLLSILDAAGDAVANADELSRLAREGLAHRRLPRLVRAERASSGRARCRTCRELIEKEAWRLSVAMFEDGRMNPIGFIHVACAEAYFDTADLIQRIDLLQPDLAARDRDEVVRALATQNAPTDAQSAGPSVAKAGEAPAAPATKRTKA